MPEFLNWWPAVLGWPAVAASLMLAAAAIVSRHPALLVVSALLAAPFGLYLGGAENWIAVAGPAIPLALLAGAYALKRGILEPRDPDRVDAAGRLRPTASPDGGVPGLAASA